VDGSGYIFRAYHALPPLTAVRRASAQRGAGLLQHAVEAVARHEGRGAPTHLAVVFDKSEKTFRTEMYPAYKAHRPDPPDDLIPQFAFIREAVRAFDLPCLEQAGFEADDLIATMCGSPARPARPRPSCRRTRT